MCIICTQIIEAQYEEMHFLFDDSLYTGYPLCLLCYDDLKDKIPEYIDCISRRIKIRDERANRIIKKNLEKWL